MALAANSYSSVADVTAMTRHLLDGAVAFDSNTVPTLTEVEAVIDDVSAILNIALKGKGVSTPVTTTDGARLCDIWVRSKAVAFVELTQRGAGFDGEENNRYSSFWNLFQEANEFVSMYLEGLKEDGVTITEASSVGLEFTGIKKHSERTDPDNTTREQPMFRRRQFTP